MGRAFLIPIILLISSTWTRSAIGYSISPNCLDGTNATQPGTLKIILKFVNLAGEQVMQRYEGKKTCAELLQYTLTVEAQMTNVQILSSSGEWKTGQSEETQVGFSKTVGLAGQDMGDLAKMVNKLGYDMAVLKFQPDEAKQEIFIKMHLVNHEAKILHEAFNIEYTGQALYRFDPQGHMLAPDLYSHSWNLKNGFPEHSKLKSNLIL